MGSANRPGKATQCGNPKRLGDDTDSRRCDAWDRLQETLLSKTVLFTDNTDWSDADIVRGYRTQHHIEAGFHRMKDPPPIRLRPQYHWTDQKIETPVFCCVLALMLCRLLRRELQRQGIDRLIGALLDQLGHIREVGLVCPATDKRRAPILKTVLLQMSDEQKTLYNALNLSRYLAP